MSYEQDFIQKIVEGALFAAGEPLSVDRLHSLFEEHEAPDKNEIKDALQAIQAECDRRAYHLVEVASGWRFQVREDLATWVNRLWEEKPQKYSRAMLETLALIAYRQPITRGDIEEVRGVAVSSHIIKTLTEREWVKVVGHRDVPGRPALYATTRQFLDYFNLRSLDELPTLGELKDIDSLDRDLEFGNDEGESADTERQDGDTGGSPDNEAAGENVPTEEGAVFEEQHVFSEQGSAGEDVTTEKDDGSHPETESEVEVEDHADETGAEGVDEEESKRNG